MAQLTPFAEMPPSPEGLIAQLRQQLAARYPEAAQTEAPSLDAVAERAVRQLWPSRIRTFVPVLALRDAQAILREQGFVPRDLAASSAGEETRDERPAFPGASPRDRLSLDRDLFLLDEGDSIHV